jgi:hypothetical protein
MSVNEYCKYEMIGMYQYHTARGSKYEHKYELLEYVSIIRRKGCMSVNEYRKYEMIGMCQIVQREGASTSASASCWNV